MTGGIGGTGEPGVSQLYAPSTRSEPEGNRFHWILAQVAIQRAQAAPPVKHPGITATPKHVDNWREPDGSFTPVVSKTESTQYL